MDPLGGGGWRWGGGVSLAKDSVEKECGHSESREIKVAVPIGWTAAAGARAAGRPVAGSHRQCPRGHRRPAPEAQAVKVTGAPAGLTLKKSSIQAVCPASAEDCGSSCSTSSWPDSCAACYALNQLFHVRIPQLCPLTYTAVQTSLAPLWRSCLASAFIRTGRVPAALMPQL